MADKFRKVKHTRVIILAGILGILDGGADGAGCGHPNRLRHLRRPVYLGVGRSWRGPGHPAMAVVGRNAYPGVEVSGRAPGHGGVPFRVVGWAGGRCGARLESVRYARISGGGGSVFRRVVERAGRSCGAAAGQKICRGFGRRRSGGQLGRPGRMVILRFTAVRRLFSPFSAPLQPLFRLAPKSGAVHPRLW